jgi:hypothetical protein
MESGVIDHPCLPDGKENDLVTTIISALERNGDPKDVREPKRVLIPVFASSLVFVVIAAGIYILTVPRPNSTNLLNSLSEIDHTISTLEERLENINSPLDAEYADLKNTMKLTTQFFASYLDVKIGQGSE